jgi:hypothetical protein
MKAAYSLLVWPSARERKHAAVSSAVKTLRLIATASRTTTIRMAAAST